MANKKYKVISLSVSGMNNNIHRYGDVVTEKMFPGKNAMQLEKEGFLKEFTKKEYKKEADKEKVAEKLAEEQAQREAEKLAEIEAEEAEKLEIEKYAKKEFKVDIDRRKSLEDLKAEVEALKKAKK